MSNAIRSERGRIGTVLLGLGVVLFAISMVMLVGSPASAQPTDTGGICHWNEGGGGGWVYNPGLSLPHAGHSGATHEFDYNAASREQCEDGPPPGATTTTTRATTVTTSAATTTTTSAATTTTAVGTTTTLLTPEGPELPDNGAGHLLAILLGGLGFVFMGSGSLVIATERRRLFR